MNAKRKGTRNEHRSILLLESAGYACTRAAASLAIFDIIGIGPTDVVLLQCKTRDWRAQSKWRPLATSRARRSAKTSFTAGATGYGCRCPHGMNQEEEIMSHIPINCRSAERSVKTQTMDRREQTNQKAQQRQVKPHQLDRVAL